MPTHLGCLVKEQVRLEGLLFSGDAQVLGVMNQILNSFAIQTEVCTQIELALDAVTHRRLDTLIVDWDLANDPTRVPSEAMIEAYADASWSFSDETDNRATEAWQAMIDAIASEVA